MNKKTNKFWNFSKNESERIMRIDGVIAEESWLDDEITPKQFKSELKSENGDITVWINSIGGDVFAASQIYNMLRDYLGKVTVKIDGIAASAASVIAMSGDEVLMSPVSLLMLHNPLTVAVGDTEEMSKAIEMLNEVKEAIINVYHVKTKLSRSKISNFMDAETWFSANKAVEFGFADRILFENENEENSNSDSFVFSRMAVTNSILGKLNLKQKPHKTSISPLYKRLNLLKGR
ncbi:hypothetical protein FACS189465_2410 [Clostridia bacterium]|nr:hypothetical protein FACS189465_2410 [Clostridia bacterium]